MAKFIENTVSLALAIYLAGMGGFFTIIVLGEHHESRERRKEGR